MATYPVLDNLPDAHNREIGRIVVTWALLEWHLRQIAYLLLGLSPRQGRLAVREPRATDYLTMVQDLIELDEIPVQVDWKNLKANISELERHRDRIAHAIWLDQRPEFADPCIQLTKGKWQPNPGKPPQNARVSPVTAPTTPDDLAAVTTSIEAASGYIKQIEMAIRTLLTSRDNSSGPPAAGHPHPADSEEADQPPSAASRP